MLFVMVVSRFCFLSLCGRGYRCLGLNNKDLARGVLQKTTFKEIGNLMISESIFDDLRWQ